MDDFSTVLIALTASAITALATVFVQIIINRQKRNDFLKEKSWDRLQALVESLSTLSIYIDNVMDPSNRFHSQKNDIDFALIMSHFEVMKQSQSYVYMTGSAALIKAFNHLYVTFQFIEKYHDKDGWELNVRMKYEQLPPQSVLLIKRISKFMRS